MTLFARMILALSVTSNLLFLATAVHSDPATRNSERTERFGYWYVVKKPATYVITDTGRQGRYIICSAVLFAKTASLEFEAKNDIAWAFYVSKDDWDYPFGKKRLSLKSGSQDIRVPAALYGGSMISGMSHDIQTGSQISIKTPQSFISQGKPISFHDNRGRSLVTFPNGGSDLSKAFASAIKCSLANAPR